MHPALLLARLLLAAVFALAALTKLADLRGSREAVAGFGVAERLARPLGTLLPFAELAVAVVLLPARTAPYGAIGACALLAAFAGAIARSMIRGESPDCHCFGQLHSAPAGPRTLIRNLALAAVGAFVVLGGWRSAGPSATAWVGRLSDVGAVAIGAGLAIVVVATLTAWALLGLLRQNGRLLLRIDELELRLDGAGAPPAARPHHGLALGTPAPEFSLAGLYGESATLRSLISADAPVLLVFTDPSCGPCNALLPQIAAWQHDHGGRVTVAVITRGTADDNRAKVREHGVGGVWLDPDLTVYHAYRGLGTPGGVLIDARGRIASDVVAGADAIAGLVDQALGVQAPVVDLLDLTGRRVELVTEDRDTLVLFWNPGCGFCQRMLDDLRAWEAAPPAGAPRLVLISTGSVQDNEAMGLDAPILLDQGFRTGSAFGTTGTPSAILVDRGGRIASALAVGAPAVMALAGTSEEIELTGKRV